MIYREEGELTKDYLARVLDKIHLPMMALSARRGHYDKLYAPEQFNDGRGIQRLIDELRGEAQITNLRSQRDEIAFVIDMALGGAFNTTTEEEHLFKNPPPEKIAPKIDWRQEVKTLEDVLNRSNVMPREFNNRLATNIRKWLKDFPNDKEFDQAMKYLDIPDVDTFKLRNALVVAMKERFGG